MKTKKRERVRPEMLNVLLSLKLYHLESTKDIATGHLQALLKKDKVSNKLSYHLLFWFLWIVKETFNLYYFQKKREEMSKKERKMAKQRAKLDKELLEAKAEESTQTRYSI